MEVLRDLLKFDIVKEAKGTFGYYDILVKIEAASEKEIEKIITKKIRKVKNVNTTTTLSVISEQENL
jgi:DNA-binding Lrp family transcriptional regulator